MDAYDCIRTKLDVRDFDSKPVPTDLKLKVLEAARLTQSGINKQHWRFILIQTPNGLKRLAEDSTTGPWIANANFAVMILTNPKYGFHLIDAGRAVQDMQLTAWNYGVASCVFTGVKDAELRRDFAIPKDLTPSITVGFGYPARKLLGKKKRQPLTEIAYLERFGNPLEPNQVK